ncbi:hypothetical protein LMB49_03775 [Limosilactobacillus reuteri]|uniref:hypothetical protein n=1 Tax=Limosilactobacillus reuteri TaxID=1598 RepID=UPI001E5E4499|nr:hypothetical protein [Limosilactobacillus reuteri]MCC4370516.1 hypothetical protein [Limosilactobacillus reuteri]MCC4509429.1 hypothetical protein [Limosilactobacillus reuteri]
MVDKNPVLGLAFDVKHPDEAIIKMLQDEFKAKQIDDKMWAFPYNPSAGDYDKFGEILGSFYVGIINSNDYSFYRNDKLNQDMIEYSGEDPEDDGSIPLSVLPDVEDFTVENADDITAAIEDVRKKHYSYTIAWDGSDDLTTIGEKPKTEVLEDIETETPAEDQSSSIAKGEQPLKTPQENVVEDDSEQRSSDNDDTVEDVVGDIFDDDKSKEDLNDQQLQKEKEVSHIQGKPDLALSLAANIFENNEPLVLQGFDDATRQQIAPDYIKAQANVGNKADESIFEMAKRIRNAHEKFENEFKEKFNESTKQHNETLDKIAAKAEQDTEKAVKESHDAYQEAKEEYVKANRPRLEAEFDEANRKTYDRNLDNKKADIEATAHKLKAEEEKRYGEASNKESAKYVERRIRQMDFSDIYEDYERTLHEETDHLAELATSFTDQVAVVTKQLVNENKALEKQNEALSKENDVLNRTMVQQTTTKAEKIANDRTSTLQQQLSDSKLTNTNLQERINELQKKNDELERDNRSLKRTQGDLLQAKETAEALIPAKSKIVEVQKESARPIEEKTTQKKKSGVGNTIVGIVAGVLIATGLGTAYMAWQGQNNVKSDTSQQAIQVTPKTATASSSSKQQYKKGDTFNYHSNKDNKDYTVTMDNSTQGHYTDSKGNYHQVTLKEGN